MAAMAAHAVSSLEVNAQDDMDLHSDSGLDFGDGDIELDLNPVPTGEYQDDDISINDATTDAAVDVQTVPADQDDFMVDDEDIVEEHNMYLADETAADPISMDDNAMTQEAFLAPEEEDLIEYDDEEEERKEEQRKVEQSAKAHVAATDDLAGEAALHTKGPGTGPAGLDHDEEHSQTDEDDQTVEHGAGKHIPRQVPAQSIKSTTNDDSDGGDGGVFLNEHHAAADEDDHDSEDYAAHEQVGLRPITLNYEGNELWLFKEHDSDDSGDWLLEDSAVVHDSLSDFLQSCRTALGEDLSPEYELGLRFDHLHNMEIYEDNTACVVVSLDKLTSLYYTLHAQDNNTEPESFYMCLLSRPRFVSQLADIAKYAEQGSGYSGLAAAVAAGETHFPEINSGHSTEHEITEWENEEEEEDGKSEHTPSSSESESAAVGSQRTTSEDGEEQNADEAQEREHEHEHEHEQEYEHEQNGEDEEDFVYEDYTNADESEPHTVDTSGAASTEQAAPGHVTQQELQDAEDLRKEQEAHDTVDYSDDEDDVTTNITAHVPSTSSSTVQGDEPATGEDVSTLTGSLNNGQEEGADSYVEAKSSHGQDEAENDAYLASYEQVDPSDPTESYEGIQDHNNDETQESLQHLQVTEQPNENAESGFEEYTNEEYTGYDFQNLEPELHDDFLSGADFNGNGANDDVNSYTGADGNPDTTESSEWIPDQDNHAYLPDDAFQSLDDGTADLGQEEEDGVDEQPAVAVSSAVDPVAASSTDQSLSPLGVKRSIDEVGNTVDWTDPITGKLYILQCIFRTRCTNYYSKLDFKRQRM